MTGPAAHDVVLVAASAGGVEALKRLVSELPADLPATLLVALHVPRESRSLLTDILARRTALRVVEAADGVPLEPGTVVVARPDRHLLVVGDRVELGAGAIENGHRPAHDAMLRSAALSLGPRAVGVVLTGMLDDGAAGLAAVARYGGRTLVQEPGDAEFPPMPRAALAAVPDARRVRLADLAREVVRIVSDAPEGQPWPQVDEAQQARDLAERDSARGVPPRMPSGEPLGEPSTFACPDCSGVLNVVPDQQVLRLRCRTGHAYGADSLLSRQDGEVQTALWTAVRVLQERAEMCRRLADDARATGSDWTADHYTGRAQEAESSSAALLELLSQDSASATSAGQAP